MWKALGKFNPHCNVERAAIRAPAILAMTVVYWTNSPEYFN
jgi:hypothetical protein